MRQRLIVIITLIVVVTVLVLLNAVSYVKVESAADSESAPDRSTFNAGATGTRALYDFLHESGYQVARWRESTASLLSFSGPKPSTLVIVGNTRVPLTKTESKELLHWVERGGRLVIIDRTPDPNLLPTSGDWTIRRTPSTFRGRTQLNDFEQMTGDVARSHPHKLRYAHNVDEIIPSRFAGAITIRSRKSASPGKKPNSSPEQASGGDSDDDDDEDAYPAASPTPNIEVTTNESMPSPAPVTTFLNDRGALLVDYARGKGRIVLLSDPYLVANNGINRADNLQLAINVIMGDGGLAAFDEFHQGRAYTQNALIQYF
jgi:hypothetical protein